MDPVVPEWVKRAHRTAELLLGVVEDLPALDGRRVVLVGGESGSGKTTLARALRARLSAGGHRVAELCQDDWYHLGPRANEQRRRAEPTWRGLVEVDLAGMSTVTRQWVGGAERLVVPTYDGEQRGQRSVECAGTDILVVEGTFVLRLDCPGLRVLLLETWRSTGRGRAARGRDPMDPHTEHVLAFESAVVQETASLADVWVDGEGRVTRA